MLLGEVRTTVEEVFWEDLRVGDVIELACGDWIPADAILLSTNSENGRTYVETKNLDGETTLKAKVTHPKVQAAFSTSTNRMQAWREARITYEGPSAQLYTFSGEIQVECIGGEKEEEKKRRKV